MAIVAEIWQSNLLNHHKVINGRHMPVEHVRACYLVFYGCCDIPTSANSIWKSYLQKLSTDYFIKPGSCFNSFILTMRYVGCPLGINGCNSFSGVQVYGKLCLNHSLRICLTCFFSCRDYCLFCSKMHWQIFQSMGPCDCRAYAWLSIEDFEDIGLPGSEQSRTCYALFMILVHQRPYSSPLEVVCVCVCFRNLQALIQLIHQSFVESPLSIWLWMSSKSLSACMCKAGESYEKKAYVLLILGLRIH